MTEPHITIDGERRPIPDNMYDGTTEEAILNMVRPAFHKDACDDDILAVAKRSNLIVNSRWFVYVRPAGTADEGDDIAVRRIPFSGKLPI